MPVPKTKSSRSRRDKRRANWKLTVPGLVECPQCHALKNLIMYALYAVTTKANRSSARLLKNNRKTFSSRGKRFLVPGKGEKKWRERGPEVLAVRTLFFPFRICPQRFAGLLPAEGDKPAGMMLQQLLESKGPVKCEFLCPFGSEDTTFPCRRWDNHGGRQPSFIYFPHGIHAENML